MDTSKTNAVRVPRELTIYAAHERKHELLAALGEDGHLTLDLAQVEEIDLAGLQLLILLKREADLRGAALHCINHSPAVVKVIDFCNLAGFLGDPVLLSRATAQ